MTNGSTAPAKRRRGRRSLFVTSQLVAFLLALYFGWHSYRMVDDDRLDIDRALLWMGAALALLAYFAWDGKLPMLTAWPRCAVTYARAHPIELLVLLGVFAIGIFVRLFRYGDLPPSGYLYFEEHINGGIGWTILQGDRPFAYPLERYASALGQWILGPSTLGLRAPLIAAGIVTMIPFYLLMRDLVERPAALVATGLFASLRVIADISVYFQVPELVTITTIWMFVRVLRKGNAVWFVPVGVGVAVLMYEYETFKAVPFLAAPFVVFFALRALLWPWPASTAGLWERARALAPRAIKPVVVTAVVILIGVGPMVAQTHRGQHIFFSSLERQKADRTERGAPGLLSQDAAEQLKWSTQVFTPFVKAEFPVLGSVPSRGAIDKITSVLLWVSMVVAVLTFWRGSRALFVSWFVGGLLFASLLLSNFEAWKVIGFLIPGVVLVGFLADDLFAWARRRSDRIVLQTAVGCAAIVAGILFLNLRTLNANAGDPRVVGEWGNTPSQLYAICDHLRSRPSDNFSYVTEGVRDLWGFNRAPVSDAERQEAWSDWKFVCWNLQGEALANIGEAWPLFRDIDGPVSLTTVVTGDDLPELMDSVERAVPGIGAPDRLTTAPGGLFKLLSYATTSKELNARRGLQLTSLNADGSRAASSVVSSDTFALPHTPGADAFTLSGLVYAPRELNASLVPEPTSGTVSVAITVDGKTTFDTVGAPGVETPQQLVAGWHVVQVRGYASSDVNLRLRWRASDGATTDPGADGFYAVEDLTAWRHTRTYAGTVRGESVRFDFHLHYATFGGMRIDATHMLPLGSRANVDRWEGRWTVEATDKYTIRAGAYGETFKMTIDGEDVLTFGPPRSDGMIELPLDAGDHMVQMVISDPPASSRYFGGLLSVHDSKGNLVAMKVHPF